MFKRIKNLAELSKYKPEEVDEKLVLTKDEGKPKGRATVIEDDPIDLFPNHDDKTSQ